MVSNVNQLLGTGQKKNINKDSIFQGRQTTDRILKEWESIYPEMTFHTGNFSDKKQLESYAFTQSGFYHVTIAPELLDQMAADPSIKEKYEKLLEEMKKYCDDFKKQAEAKGDKVIAMGIALDEEGNLSSWVTLSKTEEKRDFWKPVQEARLQNLYGTEQKESKKVFRILYKYSFSGDMHRIARARTKQSVKGLIAYKNGEISRVKSLVEDKEEARKIIQQIKTVIQKGRMKVTRMNKEEELQMRQKIAKKKQKIRMSKELGEKLRKKRMARRAMEYCDTIDMNDAFQKNPTEFKFRLETEIKIESESGISNEMSIDSGSLSYTASGEIVTVSETSVDFLA